MYTVYVLQSQKTGRYYIGQTQDIDKRIMRHNTGGASSTKLGRPWALVHSEKYQTRSEAMHREKEIKSWKGGEAFKKLIKKV